MTLVSAAFLPLIDSAPLIVAKEKGFAAAEGLDLSLFRTTSWATLRDRLVYGQVQVAHMLAPLTIAVTLGLSQTPASLSAPFKLNANGHSLVMSAGFAAALEPDIARRIADPIATAHDFAGAVGIHHRKPVIGVVHRFSSHSLSLRYFLGYAGLDPERDVTLRVLPPSLMVEALRLGEIDGFIVGEPWGTVAILEGLAELVATGVGIWRRGVDKVLAMRTDWMDANAGTVDSLLRAMADATAWCDNPANRDELIALLAQQNYVGKPAEALQPALTGQIIPRQEHPPLDIPDFLLFNREATNFPWQSQALWIYSQFVRWQMVTHSGEIQQRAQSVFRPDIYRRALGNTGATMPGASMKVEGALSAPIGAGSLRGSLTLGPDRFFDGRVFDPDQLATYLQGFTRD
jgi:NitT/TauT family transport system ATP-binding protein